MGKILDKNKTQKQFYYHVNFILFNTFINNETMLYATLYFSLYLTFSTYSYTLYYLIFANPLTLNKLNKMSENTET